MSYRPPPTLSDREGLGQRAPPIRAAALSAWLPLLGGADERGVVAAYDEGAGAAAVFAGGEADEALLEVAGDDAGVAGAGVLGGGGDP